MTCCNIGEEKKYKEEAYPDQYYLFVPMIDISVKCRLMQNCGPFYIPTFYGTTFMYLFIYFW